ncbi:phage terminase, large subunit, PBSX family (plasmid) [Borreliella afzelii PKo]|uniref:Phage terminase, large subunit, PBSX family n=1 Tax=Borreliella afzelii (strain PKo) TaxID=390236 RepID=Q0SLX8_BORAP|nr:hypothetical protein BAPKO_2028 [Borreliella afzelii PKo]AEL70646.1 phage terminase, large subunit, PBSX family [Borreliella afzelii PKo]
MKFSRSLIFLNLQKKFKNKFNINILDYIKPRPINIGFKDFENQYLTTKQKEVLFDIESHTYSKVIFSGGIASGKTFLASYLLIKKLIENKSFYEQDTNNFIIGNSIGLLMTNTIKQIEKICGLLGIDYQKKKSGQSFCKIAGLELNIYGGKNRDAFSKIRGGNSAIIYVNEATVIHKETLLEVMKRLRKGKSIIIFDTNPESPAHYFKTDYIENTDVFKTYNFTTYDNPLNSADFIETQEKLYKHFPAYKARVLYGEWVLNESSLFNEMIFNQDYEFKSPIMYIDPAFSVGGDNTAVCVLERTFDKFYAYIYQSQKPISDSLMLSSIQVLIENFNVNTVYIEERDSTKGDGILTKTILFLRNKSFCYFRVAPIKPLSNKFKRICALIPLFESCKIEFLKIVSKNVIADIYSYKGDGKTKDDALDSLANAYLLLTLNYKEKLLHFGKFKYL